MTNAELERLEALAKAAGGSWHLIPAGNRPEIVRSVRHAWGQATVCVVESQNFLEDAAFIAAANPATILSIIQRVKEAKAWREEASGKIIELTKALVTAHDAGRAAGRDEALEEAAKAADAHEQSADGEFDGVIKASRKGEKNLELAGAASAGMSHTARRIAQAIRSLKEKAP